jgi:hypothetical protein
MIYVRDYFLLGFLVGWMLSQNIAEIEKQDLLDFNEMVLRDREQLEERYLLTSTGYINHLNSHECKRKEKSLVEMKTKNLGDAVGDRKDRKAHDARRNQNTSEVASMKPTRSTHANARSDTATRAPRRKP